MAPPKRKNQLLTLMVVPRSGKVLSCNITTLSLKRIAWALVAFALVSAVFVREYRALSVKAGELDHLKGINAQQAEQIDSINGELHSIRDGAQKLRELEQKVRELIEGDSEALNRLYPGFDTLADEPEPVRRREPLLLASRSSRDQRGGSPEIAMAVLCADVKQTLCEVDEAARQTEELLQDAVVVARAYPSLMPLRGKITSTFGVRPSPFGGRATETHTGLDIAAPHGSAVVAAGDATVSFVGYKTGYGLEVVLAHKGGYTTTYAHLSQAKVKKGDVVDRGSVIGLVGQTGRATGPHLHFEVAQNGIRKDPQKFVQ